MKKYKLKAPCKTGDSTTCNQTENNVFNICQTLRKLFKGKFPMALRN